MSESKPLVGWVVGSKNDLPTLDKGLAVMKELGIPHEVLVASAHRTPDRVDELAKNAEARGWKIIIAGAGMANHLTGTFAGRVLLPVIGIPLVSGSLNGLDSLLATVQMPPGVPVACVSLGEAGAVNAAVLSARILALQDPELREKLKKYVHNLGAAIRDSK